MSGQKDIGEKHQKRKVAILGGGVGAITAAYAITTVPDWQSKYEITVYQLGWRLGGKGASGRNMEKNGRIEEHGLHIWAGFYDNSFKFMRRCYEQLVELGLRKPEDPLGTLDKAFKPLSEFYIAEKVEGDDGVVWEPWRIRFPSNSDVPGTGGEMPSPFALFQELLGNSISMMNKIADAVGAEDLETHGVPDVPKGVHAAASHLDVDLDQMPDHGGRLLHIAHRLAVAMPENANAHHSHHIAALQNLMGEYAEWLGGIQSPERMQNRELRRAYYMVDLMVAAVRGMLADHVFTDGFDPLDRWECRQWLRMHGASQESVDSSLFRGCYDYVFGYVDGDPDKPDVGAGTAIRGLLRLGLTYKGALFYKMQAGMGDTIFTPYYQVLRELGVKFEFFHAVTDLHLTEDKSSVGAIDMMVQARPKDPSGEYYPLVDVQGLPCWPSLPIPDQVDYLWSGYDGDPALLENQLYAPRGEPKTLRLGDDFDEVVLGISTGALKDMTGALQQASPQWADMLSAVKTVGTQAMQLWLLTPSDKYGFQELADACNSAPIEPSDPAETLMTSFAEPLDTWANMSDLLVRANWPEENSPQSIAYFCSPRPQQQVPVPYDEEREMKDFQDQCRAFMNGKLGEIWPSLSSDSVFDYDALFPDGGSPEERFDWQYFRVNDFGSERYVQSVTNSVFARLRSDQSGFLNLSLAGDWTLNGVNAGCVEAATNSGAQAAENVTGTDLGLVGVQDTLPGQGPVPPGFKSRFPSAAPWPVSAAYVQGRLNGWFNFLMVPVETARSMLPEGLELAPQSITPKGYHPLTFLAVEQSNVSPSLVPRLMWPGSRYREFVCTVNFVQKSGDSDQPKPIFSYFPKLYLDNLFETLSGRLIYGFNKFTANIDVTNDRYKVMAKSGETLFDGRFADQGRVGQPDSFAAFEDARRLITQPIINQHKLGHWQCVAFDFQLTEASIMPSAAEFHIGAGMMPGLEEMNVRRPSLGGGPLGSFRIWTSWSMSNPFDSCRIEELSIERALYRSTHPSGS